MKTEAKPRKKKSMHRRGADMSGVNEKLKVRPIARRESMIQGENYRITVLTESLLRLEYSRDGIFEDRATQTVINRDFPDLQQKGIRPKRPFYQGNRRKIQ